MNIESNSYRSRTYASKDLLRRYSHGSRFTIAESLIDIEDGTHILDFGGGDGTFLTLLAGDSSRRFSAVLFEPHMPVQASDHFEHIKHWNEVTERSKDRLFDLIVCQEVLEHFSETKQRAALSDMKSVLKPSGKLLVSVPVEVGPVALVKNIARWKYRKNSKDIYSYPNLAKSLFGLSIKEARQGKEFLTHMGFYYFDLRRLLEELFIIEESVGSPLRGAPLILNSQVFFMCYPRR